MDTWLTLQPQFHVDMVVQQFMAPSTDIVLASTDIVLQSTHSSPSVDYVLQPLSRVLKTNFIVCL
jgi:hypothetical protein